MIKKVKLPSWKRSTCLTGLVFFNNMENYNLTILINNKVEEKDRVLLIDNVKKDFGNLKKEELWGVRTLAYEIKHMDKAFYANFDFEAEPKSVITLDKNIRLNEDIIRYLLIRTKIIKKIKAKKSFKTEEPKKSEEVAAVAPVKETVELKAEAKEQEKTSTKRKVVIVKKKKV